MTYPGTKYLAYAVPGNWAEESACRNRGDEFVVPRHSRGSSTAPLRARIANAKAICATCPVLDECRAWALTTPDPAYSLVAGGLTPHERSLITNPSRQTGPRQSYPINHGTPGGAAAHYRRGEKPCRACRDAANEYASRQT